MQKRIKRVPPKKVLRRRIAPLRFTPEQQAVYSAYRAQLNAPLPPPPLPPPRLTSSSISAWLAKRDEQEEQARVFEAFDFGAVEQELERQPLWKVKLWFYKGNTHSTYNAQIKRNILKGKDPFHVVLNPDNLPHGTDAFNPSMWYALYSYGFHVRVQQSVLNPLLGPHTAKLYVQACGQQRNGLPPKHEWLGTCQFEFPFASEKKLLIQLRRAIRTRDYFASEDAEDVDIVFGWTEEETKAYRAGAVD